MNTWGLLILAICFVELAKSQTLKEQCEGVQFDMVPHPDNNTQFIVCVYGNYEVRECINSTCFDSTNKSCNSAACQQKIPGDSQFAAEYCRNLNTLEKIPSVDCTHFYVCLGVLDPIYAECPDGLHYSQFEQQCTSPALAKCMTAEKLCSSDEEELSTFAAENCNEYYTCNNKQLLKHMCAYGNIYSEIQKGCVADPLMTCAAHTTPDCSLESNANVYFAHSDCSKFFVCIQKEAFEGKCANGYRFDVATAMCLPGSCDRRHY